MKAICFKPTQLDINSSIFIIIKQLLFDSLSKVGSFLTIDTDIRLIINLNDNENQSSKLSHEINVCQKFGVASCYLG